MSSDKLAFIVSPEAIHKNAIAHGWYEGEQNIAEKIALIHSEASEALEAYWNRIPEGEKGCMGEELADIVIRCFDLAEFLGIDILQAVLVKHMKNKERPYRHGNKRC